MKILIFSSTGVHTFKIIKKLFKNFTYHDITVEIVDM